MFKYTETEDNTINLFIDITTVCNLNCPYCFARKDKKWDEVQTLDRIKYILKCTKFSRFDFNILLFGGEALAHPNIEEIVNECNSNTKVLNTVILTNGCIKGKYGLDAIYVFTLHDINITEYNAFKDNLKIPGDAIVNVVLTQTELFKMRYIELDTLGYKIEHSMVYDDDTIVNEDLSDMLFLNMGDKEYLYDGILYNYRDYFKIHKKIIPKDIGLCTIQELNIAIDGSISNDCNNVMDNIFTNPMFFKSYNNKFDCQRSECTDCTGTIRTTKDMTLI